MATRANLEQSLIGALGPRLSFVGLDGTTQDGTNASLNDPIRRAVQSMGSVVSNFIVADADIAPFTGWSLEQLLDYAKLEALQRIAERCTFVDTKVGDGSFDLSQFHEQVLADIAILEERLRKPYGPAVPAPAVNTMQSQGMTVAPYLPNDPFRPYRSRSWPPGAWPYPQ